MWAFGARVRRALFRRLNTRKCPKRSIISECCKEAFFKLQRRFAMETEMLDSPRTQRETRLCHRKAAAGEQSISAAAAAA